MSRLWRITLAAGAALAMQMCASSASAQLPVAAYRSHAQPLKVVVDSVSYRSDLTRVYARLIGRPHTSDRVDSATLRSGKRTLEATDIDGIDFKRYFQWEDDGSIAVEIDFAPTRKRAATLTINALHGTAQATTPR